MNEKNNPLHCILKKSSAAHLSLSASAMMFALVEIFTHFYLFEPVATSYKTYPLAQAIHETSLLYLLKADTAVYFHKTHTLSPSPATFSKLVFSPASGIHPLIV